MMREQDFLQYFLDEGCGKDLKVNLVGTVITTVVVNLAWGTQEVVLPWSAAIPIDAGMS